MVFEGKSHVVVATSLTHLPVRVVLGGGILILRQMSCKSRFKKHSRAWKKRREMEARNKIDSDLLMLAKP